jgi:hypothetical protein
MSVGMMLVKPCDPGSYLEHYGTKGMKWGIRKGRKKEGIGRAKGAVVNRNKSIAARIERRRANGGIVDTIGKKTLGADRLERMRDKQLKTIAAQNQRLTTKGKANALDMLDVATNARMRPYSLVFKTTKRTPKEVEQYEANRKKVLKGAAFVAGAMAVAGGIYLGNKGLNARNDRTLTRNGVYNVTTMGTRKFTPYDASKFTPKNTIFVPAPFKSSSNWKAPQHGPRGTLAIGR